jgi:ATP-dependent Clp protease ATP-binding subunit ClpC
MPHPVTTDRVGAELSLLHRQASELARQRKEHLTTCHLLAALALGEGPIRDLLSERGLTADRILETGVNLPDRTKTSVDRVFANSVELSRRMGAPCPNAAHLLMAVLSDASSAGRLGAERLKIDVSRLRSQAWNVGIGWPRRRVSSARTGQPAARHTVTEAGAPRTTNVRHGAQPGVTIPLFPTTQAVPTSGKRRPPNKAQTLPIMPERPQRPARRPVALATAQPTEASEIDRFALDPKRFPILTQVGTNLTIEAAQSRLDEVLGRDGEIDQVLDILAKREGNSPCLVGASGVGKTSIVRGLAQRIARSKPSASIDDRIIIEISTSELLAGTGVRGALSQRIGALRKEASQAAGKVVVFFDEIHLLLLGDTSEEGAGELKRALSRGEFPCVGSTTTEDYRRSIQTDPALSRRFTAIEVEEPSTEAAYLILEAAARKLAQHHGVRYSEQALALGISWSVRYLPERMLPEKAVSIADLAGARARRRGKDLVEPAQVAEIVSSMAGIPVERLLETDASRMLALEDLIGERVVGHGPSLRRICNVLRRNAAGLGSDRPIGTFLLLGPTGVGKTETARALALALFHTETAMTRLDMAEYSESHAVAKLIGAPPGYVGHDAGGQLTEAVRKRPYQVLLLDEIEKAHDDVLQAFLGVFDEGRLTDGRGKTIDFRNTIIIMTSNLGSEHTQAKPKRRVGFAENREAEPIDQSERVIAAARARLSPELYNRIDECLVYFALNKDEIEEIARRLVQHLAKSLATREINLLVSPSVFGYLVARGGFDACLGARPMKRTIARLIEAPLAERILSGEAARGATIALDVADDTLSIRVDGRRPVPEA